MIITGSVLVPLRVMGALITLTLCWILATIGTYDLSDDPGASPYSPRRKWWLLGGFRILSRVLLFFYGFIWISEEAPPSGSETAPVIVCNHTGFVEVLYLLYRHGCCFVSKQDNRKLPFIGKVASVLQCIFVERASEDKNGKKGKSTTTKILERFEPESGSLWPPVCMCPEGTTTTGHCLVHFHTGAFRPGQPVLPVLFEMPFSSTWGYDPSFSCAIIYYHVLGLMSQPINRLHVKQLPIYHPTSEEREDARLYAKNVCKVMADALSLPVLALEWMHKLQYEVSPKGRALGDKLLTERYGALPPKPVFTQDAFGNAIESTNDTKKDQ